MIIEGNVMLIPCLNVGSQVLSYEGRVGSCHCPLLGRGGRIQLYFLIYVNVFSPLVVSKKLFVSANLVRKNGKKKKKVLC